MTNYIYFLGTGCGKPKLLRQLPTYLIGLPLNNSVLLECGTIINEDDPLLPTNLASLSTIIISALNVELVTGLPSLLHSMRLLNRSRVLQLVAPAPVEGIVSKLLSYDGLGIPFKIEFLAIQDIDRMWLDDEVEIIIRQSPMSTEKYQVYFRFKWFNEEVTIYYTGKSKGINEPSLLTGYKFIIHDCTYSYDDAHLSAKTGLGSYKDALELVSETSPVAMFLTHFSSRYDKPAEEIAKHRTVPNEVIFAYDRFLYVLGPALNLVHKQLEDA